MTRAIAFVIGAVLAGSMACGLAVAADALAPPQIHTVAGGGSCSAAPPASVSGGSCDNVSATSAAIGQASDVAALPGGGFLYVDSVFDLVREVSSSGTVTTVAGDGTTRDTDGTLAVNSGLNDPVAVAPLVDGGFLITEYDGSVVRMVSPGGPDTATITTIAGTGSPGNNGLAGPATSIQLNFPTDAQPTADGGVLIADAGNNLVRFVSAAAAGASMSTIAGGGACNDAAASCDGMPAGAVDLHDPTSVSPIQGGSGGYLVSEADYTGANTVRRVSQSSPSGTFTTVAGVPGQPGGFGGDGGPATSAQLNTPARVVATSDGGFLIADTDNERVRSVSASGTIITIAGNGVASYAGDGGAATEASLLSPDGIAPLSNGQLLIADAADSAIREITVPPVTTIAIKPASPSGDNGWYLTPVTATVSSKGAKATGCDLDLTMAPTVFDELTTPCAFSGAGGAITGNGPHTLYAASMNSFGDKELPVSATVKIDTTPPTIRCARAPSFTAMSRHRVVTATVIDSVAGPASALVSAPADTSSLGRQTARLDGTNMAGLSAEVDCAYTVIPVKLKPTPEISAAFSPHPHFTTVRRLVVSRVAAKASVNVTCAGKGCPFSSARTVSGRRCGRVPCKEKRSQSRRKRRIDVTPLFAQSHLAPGARLQVSVTKQDAFGRVWVFVIRAGQKPTKRVSCLKPGSKVPGKGCSV